MQAEVTATYDALSARAADAICALVREKPHAVLALPSGATPLGMYRELARRARAGEADLSATTVFGVDELYGVPSDHPATNASYFREHLTPHIRLRALHVMDSNAPEAGDECARFAGLIVAAGGLDLAVLGIGANGHLAFNEPGSPFDSRTRLVALERSTREPYARYFGSLDATPATGLTLGIAGILDARSALLLGSGTAKAAIVARALEGPPAEGVPASAVQLHRDCAALLDRDAASQLRRAT